MMVVKKLVMVVTMVVICGEATVKMDLFHKVRIVVVVVDGILVVVKWEIIMVIVVGINILIVVVVLIVAMLVGNKWQC